jgi:DNA-binding transcriptional LysR family regulator
VATVELIHVAAADHPLAKIDRPLTSDDLAEHVQLVLTDRSALTAGRDYGVFSTQTWRLADLGAKHALLLAGLGWGSLPRHMIEDDLAAGRLVVLRAREWEGAVTVNTLPASLIWRYDTVLGVAAQWMRDRVSEALPPHKTTAPSPA